MSKPLVSIIVPCYNQAQYLPEALASVHAQTYQEWDCIIVNDGSPDNTEEVALEWCKKDSRFKYFKKENGGLSDARNFGIRNSIGEYILPLDADDKISTDYLQLAIKRFKEFPGTTLVYCNAELFGTKSGKWLIPDYNYERLLFMNMVFCSALYKRIDFDETKGYNIEFQQGYEDWDFWLSLLNKEDIVFRIPETCFFYRRKENSLISNISKEINDKLFRKIMKNHVEKYEKFSMDIQELNLLLLEKEITISNLNARLDKMTSSFSYKIGKIIVNSLNFVKRQMFNLSNTQKILQ